MFPLSVLAADCVVPLFGQTRVIGGKPQLPIKRHDIRMIQRYTVMEGKEGDREMLLRRSSMPIWFHCVLCLLSVLVLSSCQHPSEAQPKALRLREWPPILGIAERHPAAGELDGRYMSCDLNDDGEEEYLAVTSAGAHSASFALFTADGALMQEEVASGDRIVVLRTTHRGYHDLLCSYSDPWVVSEVWLRFDGAKYVGCRSLETRRPDRVVYVEREPHRVLACWYSDVWSMPPAGRAPERSSVQ